MITEIKIQIGPVEASYVLAITDAPKSYDGFGTLEVVNLGYPLKDSDIFTKHDARLVLIRPEHLDWHQGRYSSGLYCCWTEGVADLFPVDCVVEKLWERVRGVEK